MQQYTWLYTLVILKQNVADHHGHTCSTIEEPT